MNIERIRKKIKESPGDAGLYFDLGLEFSRQEDLEKALEAFEKALSMGMPGERIYLEKARISLKRGDRDQAYKIFSEAEKLFPECGELYAEHGRLLEREGKYLKAIDMLSEALRQGFKNADILKDLGRIYIEIKNYPLAHENLTKAREVASDDMEISLLIARAFSESGDRKRAIEVLAKSAEKDSSGKTQQRLADLFIEEDQQKKALQQLKDLAKIKPSAELYIKIALLERGFSNKDKALEALEKADELVPVENLFMKNKILNEMEITNKAIFLKSKPRSLGVNLSSKCDLKCIMCKVRENKWDMPEERIKEIVSLYPYLESIFWQGGELFLLDYFQGLFEEAASHPRLNQIVVTHGLLIDEKWAEILTRSNTTLLFSIDSVNKERYEYIRAGGKFARLVQSIDTVNSYKDKRKHTPEGSKFETAINTVVMKSNCHELEDIMEFAGSKGFDHYHYLPVDTITTEENIFRSRDPESLEFLGQALEKAYKVAEKYGIKVYNWMPIIEGVTDLEARYDSGPTEALEEEKTSNLSSDENLSAEKTKSEFTNSLPCYWPWKHMFLGEIGSVRPHEICNRAEVGNLKTASAIDIWNGEGMKAYRKGLITGENTDLCNIRCIDGSIPLTDLGFTMD